MATRRPPPLQDEPPAADQVTDYDLGHSTTYLRLLDAQADGADWREAAQIILGLDPSANAERARRIHDSHLARAQWMTRSGYRDLLRRADDADR
jgi:predicted secreted protein